MGMNPEAFANMSLIELNNKIKGYRNAQRNDLEAGIISARLTATWIINYQGKVKRDGKTPFTVKPTDLYLFDWEKGQHKAILPTKEEREKYVEIGLKWANPKNKTTQLKPGETIKEAIDRLKKM